MNKIQSSLLNMVLALLGITLISGVALGYINEWTKGPKAQMRLQKKLEAVQSVLPSFDNNPIDEVKLLPVTGQSDSLEVFPAIENGALVGAAVSTYSTKGYSGLIRIMVGFNENGSLNEISVLEQKETPGLGTKMKDERFKRQFRNQDPSTFKLQVKKDGGAVDALTGATITTRAFCEATQMAYDTYMANKSNFE
jgi:electron transport complex protein RnfG